MRCRLDGKAANCAWRAAAYEVMVIVTDCRSAASSLCADDTLAFWLRTLIFSFLACCCSVEIRVQSSRGLRPHSLLLQTSALSACYMGTINSVHIFFALRGEFIGKVSPKKLKVGRYRRKFPFRAKRLFLVIVAYSNRPLSSLSWMLPLPCPDVLRGQGMV